MTKKEAIEIIEKNKEKPLNEIKRILKGKMTSLQREKFTNEHFMHLISEWDEMGKEYPLGAKNKNNQHTRKVKGEER